MLTQKNIFIISRPQVVNALTRIRKEWEQAADGKSLFDIETPVGLLLADVVIALGFTEREQEVALGADLHHELSSALSAPGGNGNY